MKKMILTVSLLSMFVLTPPVLAVDEHHPEEPAAAATAQVDQGKIEASVEQMQELRQKIEMEKDPAKRKDLMRQQRMMMLNGMMMQQEALMK